MGNAILSVLNEDSFFLPEFAFALNFFANFVNWEEHETKKLRKRPPAGKIYCSGIGILIEKLEYCSPLLALNKCNFRGNKLKENKKN